MTDGPAVTDGDIRRVRRPVGRVERMVRRDLRRMGVLNTGVRASLAEMALTLARAYDAYTAADDGADLAKLARLNQELRQTLAGLVVDGDDDDADATGLPAPVWHAEESTAPDPGRAGRGGGGAAG